MHWIPLYSVLAALAGMVLAIQVGVNTSLARSLESNFMAVLIAFLIGTLVLIFYAFSTKKMLPNMGTVKEIPWWEFTGGLLGIAYLSLGLISAPKIGTTQLFILIVAGQLITSLIIDHFGLIGFKANPINFWKILGVLFLVVGVFLIRRF